MFGYQCEGGVLLIESVERGIEIKVFNIYTHVFSFSVIKTLFQIIFGVDKSDVRVVSLLGYDMSFPPALMRT